MDQKTYLELSEQEIKARATLSPTEKRAVDAFLTAAKALPRSICIRLDKHTDNEPNLIISKRITRGSATKVAELRKKSRCF